MNSRFKAIQIIDDWLKTGSFPDREVAQVEDARGFVTELVYGAVKRKRALEWVINACVSDRRASDRTVPYLMTGLYQLLFMSNVEEYAAVNETVEAAKDRLPTGEVKFINAILRRTAREKDLLIAGLNGQALAVRESHPDWLVERWTTRFGAGDTERLCKWNNESPTVTIMINKKKTTVGKYSALAGDSSVTVQHHDYAPDRCLVLPRGCRVTTLPGYREGLFSVQDASMVVPVDMLGIEPGDAVLDACAAPGGKAVQIAEALGGSGALVCMDLHEDRLARLRENLQRMGVSGAEIVQGDAAKAAEILGERRFSRILVDAPCTNTGVLQRRADARWRFTRIRMERMNVAQSAILDGVSGLLKRGGVLVYSVCSLEHEECGAMVAGWLGRNPRFELVRDTRLFPPDSGTDGIYAAVMRKR